MNEELVGRVFGSWKVLEVISVEVSGPSNVHRRLFCICRCLKCNNVRKVYKSSLLSGSSQSCGCSLGRKHGASSKGSRLYSTYVSWESMKQRCLNPNNSSYHRYGGRGITICASWIGSFENFLADMGERPPGTSLDRKDNDDGYFSYNCRWASLNQQANNKRTSVRLTKDGETHTVTEWAEHLGIPRSTIQKRMLIRKDVDDVLSLKSFSRGTRDIKHHKLTHDGKTLSIFDWSAELGVPYELLKDRYSRGLTITRILNSQSYKPGPKPGTIKYDIPIGSKLKERAGEHYGKLTVLSTFRKPCGQQHVTYAVCKCDCGKEIKTAFQNIKRGATKSCGCLRTTGRRKINNSA